MKLRLNKEYAQRHFFVVVLMAALAVWFGYDGVVKYPSMPARELYISIEGSEPPEGFDLDGFKRQKTHSQYGFSLLALLAAAVVGCRLLRSAKFDFVFDSEGFVWRGRRYSYDDIVKIDDSIWETKRIMRLYLADAKITLDAWHHEGVKEFRRLVSNRLNERVSGVSPAID